MRTMMPGGDPHFLAHAAIARDELRRLHRRWRDLREQIRRRLAARFVSDRDYLSSLHRREFGRMPDLDHPRGFNEKIIVKILHDRRPYLTLFSDKLRVREHVRLNAPELSLAKLYWWSGRAADFPFDSLPVSFALKANHGSGWNTLVPHKSAVSGPALIDTAQRWLASDFTIVGREWSYRNIHRAVYAEELLRGADGMSPPDYKLFVFKGRVRVIQVDEGRFSDHTQVLYDERWNVIDGAVAARPGRPVPPPDALSIMIGAAEAASLGVDFVRVDLYLVGERIVFGEMRNSPNKGVSPFRPASLDALFGDLLRLDDYATEGPAVRYSKVVAESPSLQP